MNPLTPTLSYAFRSCVAFYNAKPWKLFEEEDFVRLTLNRGTSWLAQSLGSKGGAVGFAITALPNDSALEDAAEEDGGADFERLSMIFVAESDVPGPMLDARRANKWPLASPVAFPTFLVTASDGTTRELSSDQLRTLCLAMSVITTYVATRRKQIATRQPHTDAITVRDNVGEVCVAVVQYPPMSFEESGWQSFKIENGANANANPALRDLTNTALDLPDVGPVLDRLTWSFFQDVVPAYMEDEDLQEEAFDRFVSWALFAYKSPQGTFAEQALRTLEALKTSAELEVHRRIVHPRAGIFRVLDVKRNVGMRVRDEVRGGTLDVVERIATRRLREDSGVVGMLHPISDTQWILAPGAVLYPSLPPMSPRDDTTDDTSSFAPAMETSVFGASAEWIQGIAAEHIENEYETFAEMLRATGDELPSYAAFQKLIAGAAQPGDVAREISGVIEWWTPAELNVALAFVMRTWNATPREELGGVSPDAVVAGTERVRAVRPGGGRGRRKR